MKLAFLLMKKLRDKLLSIVSTIYGHKEVAVAYERNWDSEEKPPEKKMISHLMGIVPDLVDTAFLVVGASDGGGRHIVMMAEWDEDEKSPWKEGSSNIDNKGWRVMRMTVPNGYLEVFFNTDGTKRITKES